MKHSLFDPEIQNQTLENKIVVALERVSEAFRVALWEKSKHFKLSPIQIQILIFVRFHPAEKCKISYLAKEFNMTKATISEAVRVLVRKSLLRREVSPEDARSHTLRLSPEGKQMAEQASDFGEEMQTALGKADPSELMITYRSLMSMIERLNQQGLIQVQRMCLNCRFYQPPTQNHAQSYCKFLEKELVSYELRVDCPEHQPIPE